MEGSMGSPSQELADQTVSLTIEVCIKPGSTVPTSLVHHAVSRFLDERTVWYRDGPLGFADRCDPVLQQHVESICLTDTHPAHCRIGAPLLPWQYVPTICLYQLSEEEGADDDEGEDGVPTYRLWELPAREFAGQWDALVYDSGIKRRLLSYAHSALLFSRHGVDPQLVSCNRVVLLHGPPGTGKTSLCKALAQKLTVRLTSATSVSAVVADDTCCGQPPAEHQAACNGSSGGAVGNGVDGSGLSSAGRRPGDDAGPTMAAAAVRQQYRCGQLVEVNAHSLFSKYFSESGKLVSRLFSAITDLVEEQDCLVFVLIDEVESLTAARKAAAGGGEPSDAIRAVNALLTQLDQLRRYPNVMILTTSNIAEAIDLAFVDRADIKAYIGPPSLHARYDILKSAIQELSRAGIIAGGGDTRNDAQLLAPFAEAQALLRQAGDGDSSAAAAHSSFSNGSCHMVAEGNGHSGGDDDGCSGDHAASVALSRALLLAAAACEGFSGRALRKLPFLAHSSLDTMQCGGVGSATRGGGGGAGGAVNALAFIHAVQVAAMKELGDRSELLAS